MRRQPIAEYLESSILVLDGGQGTEMERRGIDVIHPLWSTLPFIKKNPTHLNHIKGMYHDFSTSGARALSTITYQASFATLKQYSDGQVVTEQQYQQFLNDIIGFTRDQCISDSQYLIGCVGPYAAYLCNGAEYSGDYGSEKIDFKQYFKPQLDVFSRDDRIDMVGFETIPNIEELKTLLSKDFTSMLGTKPFYISISTDSNGNLRDGTPVAKICETIKDADKSTPPNLLFLGINCVDYHHSYNILSRLNGGLGDDCSLLFKAVYPNSGEIYDGNTHTWHTNSEIAPELTWNYLVSKFAEQKCQLIGGCCRTTPDDIKQIADAVNKV